MNHVPPPRTRGSPGAERASGQAGGWEGRCLCCLESHWGRPSRAVRWWGGSGAESGQLGIQGTVPRPHAVLPRGARSTATCQQAASAGAPARPSAERRCHSPSSLRQRRDRSISDAVLLFSQQLPHACSPSEAGQALLSKHRAWQLHQQCFVCNYYAPSRCNYP